MTRHRLTLRRATVIPPDVEIGVRMRRTAVAAALAAEIPAEEPIEPGVSLPAGSDAWYDSPTNSVIPFAAYAGVTCAPTNATLFGVDDDTDFEGDIVGLAVAPTASAWWQITVPADSAGATLTLDTWQTRGGTLNAAGDAPATYPTDTNIAVLTTAETPPLGPLPTGSTDFATLDLVQFQDDSGEPPDFTYPYLTTLTCTLDPGKVYWIRVDTWGGESDAGSMYFDGIVYRLRVTVELL